MILKLNNDEKGNILICSMSNYWGNVIMNLSLIKSLEVDSVVASLLIEDLR